MNNLTKPVLDYIHDMKKELSVGNSTEHTHRPALKTLLETVAQASSPVVHPVTTLSPDPAFLLNQGVRVSVIHPVAQASLPANPEFISINSNTLKASPLKSGISMSAVTKSVKNGSTKAGCFPMMTSPTIKKSASPSKKLSSSWQKSTKLFPAGLWSKFKCLKLQKSMLSG
jgi:hypothetical protein